MSNLENTHFNASQTEEVQEFDLIPAGEYPAIAIESEIKQHDSGAQSLLITFQIVAGKYQNRKVWLRQNWLKKDRTPNAIGQRFLGDLCRSVGVMNPKDTCELHGRPVSIKLACKKEKDQEGNPRDVNVVNKINAVAKQAPAPSQVHPSQPHLQQVAQQQQPYQPPVATAGAWANQPQPVGSDQNPDQDRPH